MLEWRRDRCNDGEDLFGVRRFATNVTDLLVLSKCGELRVPQAVAVGRVEGLLKIRQQTAGSVAISRSDVRNKD
jgi:hypothetical protein